MVVWRKPSYPVLGMLLALSVGAKLALGASEYSRPETQGTAKTQVTGFLTRHGFGIEGVEEDTRLVVIAAGNGACQLRVAIVSAQGWDRDVVRELGQRDSRIFFVVDGVMYRDQPVWRTRAYYYWRRLNGLGGRALPDRLTLGVVASPGCDWLDTSWAELADRS